MNDYKFVCPVCSQHIKCDTSQGGRVIDCPTCLQKIIAPLVPENPNSLMLLKGTKASDRPPVSVINTGSGQGRGPSRVLTTVAVITIVVACIGVVAIFAFRWSASKTATPPVIAAAPPTPVNQTQAPAVDPSPPPPSLPAPGQYWTLDLSAVQTPETAVAGSVHGNPFVATRMVLDDARLTLRTADYPPQAGVTIFLEGNTSRDVAGKTFNFRPQSVNTPWVNLRYKDAQGKAVEDMQKAGGYALRLELGPIIQGEVSGKIYLCTGDAAKSYVVGNFIAEVLKP